MCACFVFTVHFIHIDLQTMITADVSGLRTQTSHIVAPEPGQGVVV